MPFPRAEPHLFPIFCIAFSTAGQGFFRKERRSPPPAKLFSPRPFSRASSHSAGVLRRGGDFHGVGKAFPAELLFAARPGESLAFPTGRDFHGRGICAPQIFLLQNFPRGRAVRLFSSNFSLCFPAAYHHAFCHVPTQRDNFSGVEQDPPPSLFFLPRPAGRACSLCQAYRCVFGGRGFPPSFPRRAFYQPGKIFLLQRRRKFVKIIYIA